MLTINENKETKVVGFDLDGTLFSVKKAIKVFNRECNQTKKLKDITEYNFANVYNISEEEAKNIWKTFGKEIYSESKLIEKVYNLMNYFVGQGYKIAVITARPTEYSEMHDDIFKRFDITPDYFHIGQSNKYQSIKTLGVSYFFDDYGEMMDELSKTDIVESCNLMLIDAPYNQKFKHLQRFLLD